MFLKISVFIADEVKIKAEPGTVGSCCDLCHEPAEDPVSSASCEHSFCRSCITDYIGSVSAGSVGGSAGLRCPDCDQALTIQLAPVLSNINSSSNGKGTGAAPGRRSSGGRASNGSSAQELLQTQDSASVWDAAKVFYLSLFLNSVNFCYSLPSSFIIAACAGFEPQEHPGQGGPEPLPEQHQDRGAHGGWCNNA